MGAWKVSPIFARFNGALGSSGAGAGLVSGCPGLVASMPRWMTPHWAKRSGGAKVRKESPHNATIVNSQTVFLMLSLLWILGFRNKAKPQVAWALRQPAALSRAAWATHSERRDLKIKGQVLFD